MTPSTMRVPQPVRAATLGSLEQRRYHLWLAAGLRADLAGSIVAPPDAAAPVAGIYGLLAEVRGQAGRKALGALCDKRDVAVLRTSPSWGGFASPGLHADRVCLLTSDPEVILDLQRLDAAPDEYGSPLVVVLGELDAREQAAEERWAAHRRRDH